MVFTKLADIVAWARLTIPNLSVRTLGQVYDKFDLDEALSEMLREAWVDHIFEESAQAWEM
jgi:hypothetical protein